MALKKCSTSNVLSCQVESIVGPVSTYPTKSIFDHFVEEIKENHFCKENTKNESVKILIPKKDFLHRDECVLDDSARAGPQTVQMRNICLKNGVYCDNDQTSILVDCRKFDQEVKIK